MTQHKDYEVAFRATSKVRSRGGSTAQAVVERRYPLSYSHPLVVRDKFGDEMHGIEVDVNGITFSSPYGFPRGKILELILCRGAILMDAEVQEMDPAPDANGRFTVRARFLNCSSETLDLIADEIEDMNA